MQTRVLARTNGFLLRVEPLPLGHHLVALRAVDVEGHLKADDQDALPNLGGTLSEWVAAIVLRMERRGRNGEPCMHAPAWMGEKLG